MSDSPPANAPLRIAVVGAGQVGSAFAFQLVRVGGHAVTVVARPGSERLQQLRQDGDAIVDARNERAQVGVTDALDVNVAYDVVLVTLLAHQMDAVMPALQHSAATSILFLCNNFSPQRTADAVGAERAHFGMPFVQATLKQGRLHATLGAGGQKSTLSAQRWVDVFVAAGIPAQYEARMKRWLRCHAPLCVAFEAVSVAGQRRSGGATWREASTLARGMHACFALIEALDGVPVYPPSKRALLYRTPAAVPASMLWTMSRITSFRQLLASGERECVALVDVMVQAARKAERDDLADVIAAMKPAAAATATTTTTT